MSYSPDLFPTQSWSGVDDIVIVGGGLAGLFCALKLAPRPVTVMTDVPLGAGASAACGQGGIAAAVSELGTPEAHVLDTIAAGDGLVDERVAALMAREARARVEDLLGYGVPLDRDLEGRLASSRAATHSARRILQVRGAGAGRAIMAGLVAAVRRTPSIRVIEGFVAEGLTVDGQRVTGVTARPGGGHAANVVSVPAHSTVLATGGIGHLYARTTNPAQASGHGLAMAARAGAILADLEFVQFHPTALDIGLDPAPAVAEAVRAAGAALVDGDGGRFMAARHPDAELAPGHVVARAVFAEIAAGRGAFLDAREAIGSAFPERFPTLTAACRAAGIDPVRDRIPVAPAAHFHMGGILTDGNGRTTLDGLWACGEVASTGAHGASRLAANALLEAVVFAARIAEDVKSMNASPRVLALPSRLGLDRTPAAPGEEALLRRLRTAMSAGVGVTRDRAGLARALGEIAAVEAETHSRRLANMAVAARLVAAAALAREESRGAHARADFPRPCEKRAQRTLMRLGEAERIAADARDGRAGAAPAR